MRVIPSKRVRAKFNLIYELKGAEKAIDFLAKYYKIETMRIVIDGRKVGNNDRACYDCDDFTAYFKTNRICKRLVLHEFFHHLANVRDWDISERKEDIEANRYARIVSRRS